MTGFSLISGSVSSLQAYGKYGFRKPNEAYCSAESPSCVFSLNHSNKSAQQPVKDNDSLVFGCFLEELRNWLHGEGRLRDTIGGGDKAHLRGSK